MKNYVYELCFTDNKKRHLKLTDSVLLASSTYMGQQHNKEGRQGNQKRIVSVSEDCKL